MNHGRFDQRRQATIDGDTSLESHEMLTDISEAADPVVEEKPHSLFTRQQKMIITVLVSLASVFSPMSATIYVPALPTIASDLNVSVSLVNLSVTSYMIFQGLSPSLWGSLTDVLGRRPIYLITLAVYIGACIGLSLTDNYTELILFRCLQSTGSASTIAIGAGVIGDMTQRRERGGYIGLYSAGSLVGNAVGPILGGIFAQKTGWHGIFYFLVAFAGLFVLVLFLVLPETLRAIVDNGSLTPEPSYLHRPVFSWLTPVGAHAPTAENPRPLRKKIDVFAPFKMMCVAEVFCGLIFTALNYTVWQAVLVATSSLFQSVYHLNEISVGLCFIANGVGAVSASLVVGRILNYDYQRAQRLAKQQAEQDGDLQRVATTLQLVVNIERTRLRWAPLMIFVFMGTTLAYGWCVEARTTVALPILWTFFTGFTTTAIMSMFSTLVVDWYPESGASATAAINLARCLLGAGGTAAVQPMIDHIGIGWTCTVGVGIVVASLPLGLLTYIKGGSWRTAREERAIAKLTVTTQDAKN